MKTQYDRIKERFDDYLSKGIQCLVAYQTYPLDKDMFQKLKNDGFKLRPYNGKNGLFIEITKG